MAAGGGKSFWNHLLSLWWISWFGIIGAFLATGAMEYRYMSSAQTGAIPGFSLTLLIVTTVLWVVFYAANETVRRRVDGETNKQVVVELLTLAGTFLAIFTLIGTFFFIYIAPRLR
jgi:hypothetical protein